MSPPVGAGTDGGAGLAAGSAACGAAAWAGGGGRRGCGLGRCCRRRLGPGLGLGALRDEGHDIVAGHAAGGTAAGQLRDIDVVLAHQPTHRRRHATATVGAGWRRARGWLCLRLSLGGRLRVFCRRFGGLWLGLWLGGLRLGGRILAGRFFSGSRRVLGSRWRLFLLLDGFGAGIGGRFGLGRFGSLRGFSLGGRLGCGTGALGVDLRDRCADGNGLAVGNQDLRDGAADLGRHLGVHLVGDDLEQRVVLLDAVAFLDEPALDRALGDRLAQLGHLDRRCHR